MLHHLMDYAKAHLGAVEPGFTAKAAHWALALSTEGAFLEVLPLGDPSLKKNQGRTFPRCPELSQPELIGGKEPRSHFLVESAEVVALHFKPDEKPANIAKGQGKHRYFIKLLREAATALPELALAAQLLDDAEALELVRARFRALKVKPTDKVTLAISDRFPVENDCWHAWWRMFRAGLAAQKPAAKGKEPAEARMLCLASGELCAPLRTHPKIAGLSSVGGQAARVYFSVFGRMLRLEAPAFSFDNRNKRPPRDPLNALLFLVEGRGLKPSCMATIRRSGRRCALPRRRARIETSARTPAGRRCSVAPFLVEGRGLKRPDAPGRGVPRAGCALPRRRARIETRRSSGLSRLSRLLRPSSSKGED